MSSQIKEQQKKVESKRDFDADHLLNQHVFKTLGYTGMGFAAGLASSLFFKHRAAMTLLFAGAGAGYGLSNMYSDLNNLHRFKNYSQGQPQTILKREDQLSTKDWESFKPKEQSLNTQKQPRYGGSDDDSNDSSKDSKESKASKESKENKDKKPDQKFGIQTDLKVPPTTSKSNEKNRENDKGSHQFSHPKSSESNVPGSQHKESEKTKEAEKNVKHSEMTKQSFKHAKQPEKTVRHSEKPKESDKHVEQPKKTSKPSEKSKELDAHVMEPEKKGELVSYPITKVEGQQFQDFTPKEAGKPKEGESTLYKGAERKLKSGRDQYSVTGDGPTNLTKQDFKSKTKTQGARTGTDPIPENVAGGQFRGTSTAGSQTNVVIE